MSSFLLCVPGAPLLPSRGGDLRTGNQQHSWNQGPVSLSSLPYPLLGKGLSQPASGPVHATAGCTQATGSALC